ncbi:MAG: hypothetical protein DRI52_05245, partial [Chloroflexi bacterium]
MGEDKAREIMVTARRVWVGMQVLVIALILVFGVRPPQPLVTLGPQRHVETINPKMGVHTRLTDEVEEWKIKRTLEMVREMGAPWIVEY